MTTSITTLQKQRIAAILNQDPSQIVIQCEAPGCRNAKPLAEMCSMAIQYRMPGLLKNFYQCPDEQHYGCTHEHAILAMLRCLVTDIEQGDHTNPKNGTYESTLLQHIEQQVQALTEL